MPSRSLNRSPFSAILLAYLWSIPLLMGFLWFFDITFDYDGGLMFWVVAAYILPVHAISEASGLSYGKALAVFVGLLLLSTTLWLYLLRKTAIEE